MKKATILLGLFLLPIVVSAQTVSFTNNLSYGMTGPEVSQLQEFLMTQGVLGAQYDTGNFYSLTLQAVKTFQTKEGITPVSGFVGPITRGVINAILASEVTSDEGNASTSTPPLDLSKTAPTTTVAPITIPDTQTQVTPPIPQPSAPQTPLFTGFTGTVVSQNPACQLTGTTTPYSQNMLSGTIDWTTQNASQITLSDSSNGVTWKLTPVDSGSIRDVIVYKNGTTYTATIDGGVTCSIALP